MFFTGQHRNKATEIYSFLFMSWENSLHELCQPMYFFDGIHGLQSFHIFYFSSALESDLPENNLHFLVKKVWHVWTLRKSFYRYHNNFYVFGWGE
jgi:hypothetical protein